MHGYRRLRMFRRPVQALRRRHRTPALAQGAALRGRQRLEPLECRTNPGTFLRRQVVEGECVLAQLAALFGCHPRPSGQASPDRLLFSRRQGSPMVCVVGEVPLPLRRQPVPLSPHGCEHALLFRGQVRPFQRLHRSVGLRLLSPRRSVHRNRGNMSPRRRCGKQAHHGEQHGWHNSAHVSFRFLTGRMPRSAVRRASGRNRDPAPFPSGRCRFRE